MEGSIGSQPENGKGQTHPNSIFMGTTGGTVKQLSHQFGVPETVCHAPLPVVSFSHHYDVLGKRLALDSTDRENHFFSPFENAMVHNVGQNEGNPGTVRTINNSKPLRVNFLHDSPHFVGSRCSPCSRNQNNR